MINIILIGGTKRAIATLNTCLSESDVRIKYLIIMKGYEHEYHDAMELEKIAQIHHIPYVISNEIDAHIAQQVIDQQADLILGGGIWRSIVPDEILNSTTYGYIGLHGTPLPELRGAAGINWQILLGKKDVRMRLLRLDNSIDHGPLVADKNGVVLEYKVDIDNNLHLADIFDEYEKQHLQAVRDLFNLIRRGNLTFVPQNHEDATYACFRGPDDNEINWSHSSIDIFNLIRSQSKPYTGAFTYYDNQKVTIWKAEIPETCKRYEGRIVGKVVERDLETDSVFILTGDTLIRVLEAETTSSQTVCEIFSSIRKRCKSKIETVADILEEKCGLSV